MRNLLKPADPQPIQVSRSSARRSRRIRRAFTLRPIARDRVRQTLAIWLVTSIVLLPAPGAFANPHGGRVASGQAQITTTSETRLDITQQSARAVINWNRFDIDAGETTHFEQPKNAWTLNRVPNAKAASQILGTLSATANVAVINPSGVIIGDTGTVDASGFLATTMDIPDGDFMAGSLHFSIPGQADGTVQNHGRIRVGEGGFASLVAPWIENSGEIHARLGRVALASGEAFTLDFYGDGLIEFDTSASAVGRHLSHSGKIIADGGAVALTLQETADVVESVLNLDGLIEAQSVEEIGGMIVLRGAANSEVLVSGELLATGDDAGEAGGRIEVLGGNVELASSARLDVSGKSGGGQVRVGGDFHGDEALLASDRTTIRDGARVSANATASGDAGDVAIWADGKTEFRGTIEATATAGAGGFVEVSGHEALTYRGDVALGGETANGRLLLDPVDIVVGTEDDLGTTILSTDLSRMLRDGTNVDLLADQSIRIEDEIDGRSLDGSGGDGDLSLTAVASDIVLNDDLLTRDGNINLESQGGSILMTAGNGDSFVTQGGGTGAFSETGDITLTTRSVASQVDAGFLLTTGDVRIGAAGDVRTRALIDTRGGAGTGSVGLVAGGDLLVDRDVATDSGDIALAAGGTFDQFAQANIASASGDLSVIAGDDAFVADLSTSGNVSIQSGGVTRIQGTIERNGPARGGDAIDVRATGTVFVDAGASLLAANDAIRVTSTNGGIEVAAPSSVLGTNNVTSDTGIEAENGDVFLTANGDIISRFLRAGERLDVRSTNGQVTLAGLTQSDATGANAVSVRGQSVDVQDRLASAGNILVEATAGDLEMTVGAFGRAGQIRSEGGAITLRATAGAAGTGNVSLRNVGTSGAIDVDAARDLSLAGLVGRETAVGANGDLDLDAGRDVNFASGGSLRSEGLAIRVGAGRDLTLPFDLAAVTTIGVDARVSDPILAPSAVDGSVKLTSVGAMTAAQIDGAIVDLSSTGSNVEIAGIVRSTTTGIAPGIRVTGESVNFTAGGELQSQNGTVITATNGDIDTRAGAIFAGAGTLRVDAQGGMRDLFLGDASSTVAIDASAGRDIQIAGTLGNGSPDATTGAPVDITAIAGRNLVVDAGSLVASAGGNIQLTALGGLLRIDADGTQGDGIDAAGGTLRLQSNGLLSAQSLRSTNAINLASRNGDIDIIGQIGGLPDAGTTGAGIEAVAGRNINLSAPIDTMGDVRLEAQDGDVDLRPAGAMGIDARNGTVTLVAGQGPNGSGSVFVSNAVGAGLVIDAEGDVEFSGVAGAGSPTATSVTTGFTFGGNVVFQDGGLLRTNGGDINMALANGGLTIVDAPDTGILAGAGDIRISASGPVQLGSVQSSGLIDIAATSSTLTIDGNIDGMGNSMAVDGGISLAGSGGITLLGDVRSDRDVSLTSTGGSITMSDFNGNLGQVESTEGGITITAMDAAADVFVGSLAAPGGIAVNAGRNITLAGLVDVKGAPLDQDAPGFMAGAGRDLFVLEEIQTQNASIDLNAAGDIVIAQVDAIDASIATISSEGGDLDVTSGGDLTLRGGIRSGAGNVSLVSGVDSLVLIQREDGLASVGIAAIETGAGNILVDGGGVQIFQDLLSDEGDITLRARSKLLPLGSVQTRRDFEGGLETEPTIASRLGDITMEAQDVVDVGRVYSNGALCIDGIDQACLGVPGADQPSRVLIGSGGLGETAAARRTFDGQEFAFSSIAINASTVVTESLLESVGDVSINAKTARIRGVLTAGGDISIATSELLALEYGLFSNGGDITLGQTGNGPGLIVWDLDNNSPSNAAAGVGWVFESTRAISIDSRMSNDPSIGGNIEFLDRVIGQPSDDGIDVGTAFERTQDGATRRIIVPAEPSGDDLAIRTPVLTSYETVINAGGGVVGFTGENRFDILDIQSASKIEGLGGVATVLDAHQIEGILLGQTAGGVDYSRAFVEDERDGNLFSASERVGPVDENSFGFQGVIETTVGGGCANAADCTIQPGNFFSDGVEPYAFDPGFGEYPPIPDPTIVTIFNNALFQAIRLNELAHGVFTRPSPDPTLPDFLSTNATQIITADSAGAVTYGYSAQATTALEDLVVNLRDTPSPVNSFVFTGINFVDQPPQPNARDLAPGTTDLAGFGADIARSMIAGDARNIGPFSMVESDMGFSGGMATGFVGGFDSPGVFALFGSLDDLGSVGIDGSAGAAGAAPSIPMPTMVTDDRMAAVDGDSSETEFFARQQNEEDEEEEESEVASKCPQTDVPTTYQSTPSGAAFGTAVTGNPYTIDAFCGNYVLVSAPSKAPSYESLSFIEADFWDDRNRAVRPSPLQLEDLPAVAAERP